MLASWIVVVDDGTRPFGPGISPDQRRPLSMVIGEDARLEISLISPVGGAMILGDGDFLQLNARTLSRPQRQVLTTRSSKIGSHRYAIVIAADATKNLSPVRGEFDLWLVQGAARVTLIPLSEFVLAPSALGINYM